MTRLFARLTRFLLALVLLAAVYVALNLPRASGILGEVEKSLERLPDFNYLESARKHWASREKAAALACLEYAAADNPSETEAASALYAQYLKEISGSKSASERLLACGKLPSSRPEVRPLEELRMLFPSDAYASPSISAFEMVCTQLGFYEDAPGFMRVAMAEGLISEMLQIQLGALVRQIPEEASKLGAARIEEIKAAARAFHNMASNCETWTQFSVFLKNCDSVSKMRAINLLIRGNPECARRLERILILSGQNSEDSLAFALRYSSTGVDILYASLRKGPRVLRFVSRHPQIVSATFGDISKVSYPTYRKFLESAAKRSMHYGALFELARWGAVFGFAFLAAFLLIAPRFVARAVKKSSHKKIGKAKTALRVVGIYAFLAFAVCVCAFAFRLFYSACAPSNETLSGAAADDKKLMSATAWVEASWLVEIKMREDFFINEDYSASIFAPLVEISGKKYIVCDFSALGFRWGEIKHERVYELSMSVSKGGDNSVKVDVGRIYVLKEYENIVLIEMPNLNYPRALRAVGTEDFYADDILLFSASKGLSLSSLDLSLQKGRTFLRGAYSFGDALVTKNGLYLGIITRKGKDEALAIRIPSAEYDFGAKVVIPLSKPDGQHYYRSFCEALKSLW